jgi:excisionase family DNA binding protein
MPPNETGGLTPLVVNADEAARLLSMSRDSFDRWVRPELRAIRRSRLVLFPISELQAWVERTAERTFPEWR